MPQNSNTIKAHWKQKDGTRGNAETRGEGGGKTAEHFHDNIKPAPPGTFSPTPSPTPPSRDFPSPSPKAHTTEPAEARPPSPKSRRLSPGGRAQLKHLGAGSSAPLPLSPVPPGAPGTCCCRRGCRGSQPAPGHRSPTAAAPGSAATAPPHPQR